MCSTVSASRWRFDLAVERFDCISQVPVLLQKQIKLAFIPVYRGEVGGLGPSWPQHAPNFHLKTVLFQRAFLDFQTFLDLDLYLLLWLYSFVKRWSFYVSVLLWTMNYELSQWVLGFGHGKRGTNPKYVRNSFYFYFTKLISVICTTFRSYFYCVLWCQYAAKICFLKAVLNCYFS